MSPRSLRALQYSVAFVWLATAVSVPHPAYREIGAAYLGKMGLGPTLMWVACGLELALGIVVAIARPQTWLHALQASAIVAFTAILAILDPSLLAHPFGVLTKNLPLLAVLAALELHTRGRPTRHIEIVLRAGVGIIWITEGLFPKILFQRPEELDVVANSGLVPLDPGAFLVVLGAAQILAGLGVWFLPARVRRWLLLALAGALVVLPVLVSWQDPTLWVHPFGPLIKNVPILAATIVLAATRWSP